MADQKHDQDEYQFDDLNTFEPGLNQEEKTPEIQIEEPHDSSVLGNPVIRNALIAVTVVIFLMVSYKLYNWFSAPKAVLPKVVVKPLKTSLPKIQTLQPPVQTVQTTPPPISAKVEEKLEQFESSQQTIQSNMSTMQGQLGDVNNSVTQLNQKLESLTQTIAALNEKIDHQSQELVILNERTLIKPKPIVIHHAKPKPKTPPPIYYIQAIIPGRAWLIAKNGTTITIRNGSIVPGYGTVTFVDPRQGRVVTSSGRVIRFSPADN